MDTENVTYSQNMSVTRNKKLKINFIDGEHK